MTHIIKRASDSSNVEVKERTDRFFKKYDHWYFKTREGAHMGPYLTKTEAVTALRDFIDFIELAKPETRNKFTAALS